MAYRLIKHLNVWGAAYSRHGFTRSLMADKFSNKIIMKNSQCVFHVLVALTALNYKFFVKERKKYNVMGLLLRFM